MKINIYIITSDHLKLRFNNLNTQIGKLKEIFDKLSITYKFHQINNPSSSDIEKNLDKYKEIVSLKKDEIDDDDFKNQVIPINTSQISNIIKHLKAYELIKTSDDIYHLIIEDDIIIIDEFIPNFNLLLSNLNNFNYDLVFTGIAINQPNNFNFIDSYKFFKVLVSKCSYFVSKECAVKLIDFHNKIRFPMKLSLSYFIWNNKNDIKSYISNKNIFFEGSKIGLFTSSINNNNFLYQNGEFVKLTQLIGDNDFVPNEIVKKAEEIYNSSGKNNPDFLHTIGLAYYKNKNFKKAKDTLIEAVMALKKNDGYISQHNEILNNCINMHQYEQSDIDNALKLSGIYS